MGRFPEGALEGTTEVRGRQPGGRGQVGHRKRLGVPTVGQIAGPEEMAGHRHACHPTSMAALRWALRSPTEGVAARPMAGG